MATGAADRPSFFEQASGSWRALSRELKILVGVTALVVVGVAGYFLATASQTDATKVPLFDGIEFTRQERVLALRAFAASGLTGAEIAGDLILVPKDRQSDFLRALPEGMVPGNLESAMDEYVENDSWWKSRDESRRQFLMYTARKISQEIKRFPEIIDASVTVTQPPPVGLRRIGEAKASVSVSTLGMAPLSPVRHREIQNLVAHSFNNLEPHNVFVVANTMAGGANDGDGGPVDTRLAELENKALQAKELHRKTIEHHLRRALSHLPGVTVVANVEVEPSHDIFTKVVTYDKGVPFTTDTTTVTEETPIPPASGGPPGTRTNVDAPPTVPNLGAAAAVATATSSDESSSSTYNNNMVQTTSRGQDFKPTLVGVVVNVPRELLEASTVTGADGQPQVQAAVTTEQDIVEAITRLNYPGLTADMIKVVRATIPEPLPAPEGPSVVVEVIQNHWMDLLLALLALIAVITAFILARRAPMPEIVRAITEEETEREVTEEAELAGLQEDEQVNKMGKMQETVAQIVTSKPEAAASLVRRWIQQDE